MRKNTIWKSSISILCCITLLFGSFGFVANTVQAKENLSTDFTEVTPREFGIADYEDTAAGTMRYGLARPSVSADKMRFKANVIFGDSWNGITLFDKAGENDPQPGRGIAINRGWVDTLRIYNNCSVDNKKVYAGGEFVDGQFTGGTSDDYADISTGLDLATTYVELAVTTEYVDFDKDGAIDDLKMGVYIGGTLCNSTYFHFLNCDIEDDNMYCFSNAKAIKSPDVAPLPKSFTEVTPREFGIADYTDAVAGTMHYGTAKPNVSADKMRFKANVIFGDSWHGITLFDKVGGETPQSGRGITITRGWVDTLRIYNNCSTDNKKVYVGGEFVNGVFTGGTNDDYTDMSTGLDLANTYVALAVTTEYVDFDQDGTADDLKIGVYIGGILYNDTYLHFLNCNLGKDNMYCFSDAKAITSPTVAPLPEPEPEPNEEMPADFKKVTPLNFGFIYDTYSSKNMSWSEIHSTTTTFDSMNQVLFETRLTLETGTQFIYTKSNNSEWHGLTLALETDGTLNFRNSLTSEDVYVAGKAYIPMGLACYKFQPEVAIGADITTFRDVQFQLALTTEFVAYDGDAQDDLKLGVWFNGRLYDEEYIYILNCKDDCQPSMLLHRGGEGNIILETPETTERATTNERYNLSDGPYLISGTGKILVNGVEYQNGDTLTIPGTYQIVSDNGTFVRNVELYDAGKKSSALAHEENVMPIAGFHGPRSGDSYNYVTDEIYALLEDVGINLINYNQTAWAAFDLAARNEVIKNLIYAEKHNIGLYIGDYRIPNTELSAAEIAEFIAPYSQYESFKGIFVADEPGNESYNSERPISIDDVAKAAKSINIYANLHGYINLLPLNLGVWENSYKQYIDEYVTKTDAKMISHDYYVFAGGRKPEYFNNLRVLREKSLEHKIPFWTFIQAGNWEQSSSIPSGTPTEGEFMWNVNTALAYGTKGIEYYPLIELNLANYDYERYGILDVNGEPTKWYPYAKKINKHIAAIDEVLMQAESKAVLAIGTNAQSLTKITASAYGSLSSVALSDSTEGAVIGAFDYQGKEAFYVVNFDMAQTETITLKFKGVDNYQYRMIQNAVTSTGIGRECTLTIPAGEAVLIVLEEKATIVDGMRCLTPLDFGFTYGIYEGKDVSVGETHGMCNKISSMDKVMMKTNITFDADTELRYMKTSNEVDAHWAGLTFSADSAGILHFRNSLTFEDVYVKDTAYIWAGLANYKFYPEVAFDESVTSFIGKAFNLTIISEFVDYDNDGSADDLKLGVYFNDKLYDDAYIYIKDCKDTCYSNLFLYRPYEGSITLASPMAFDVKMQPEITDSIAMNFVATLDYALLGTETPYMTFEMNGEVLERVAGKAKEAGGNVYIFTYPDVMLQNLSDTVTATLKMGSSTKTYECSMMDYFVRVLKAETLTDDVGTTYTSEQLKAIKELIVDLVQYATEVQKYRGNQTTNTWFTTILETEVPNYTALYDQEDAELSALSQLKAVDQKLVDSNTGAYRWKNVGLVISNKIKLRARFTASDVSGLTIKTKVNGIEKELTFKETSEVGVYVIDFTDIYAYEYDEEVTIRFYKNGTATGAELHYSVNTYLKEMYTTGAVKNLLLAIHNYGTTAKAFMLSK